MKQKLIIGTVLCALLIGLSIGPVWAAPAATNQIVHVVRWGENLIYIAEQYGTSVQAIMNVNGLGNPKGVILADIGGRSGHIIERTDLYVCGSRTGIKSGENEYY